MDDAIHLRTGDVIRTVAYFDVFKYPLTNEQIYRFLPRNSVTQQTISDIIRHLVADGILDEYRDFFYLPSQDREIVERRSDDERRARKMIRIARVVSRILKQFPFTRAVFITGSLSKNVAAEDSDIDFMIITSKDRLWICKTILTFFRKIFLFGSHKYFCTNFYVSEDDYELPARNRYAAIELLTTRVMWNATAFMEFQRANTWALEYLPNCAPTIDEEMLLPPERSTLQRLVEAGLELLPLQRINSFLMNRFKRHWASRFPAMSGERRDAAFRTSPNASTVWQTDYQQIILSRYHETLSQLGFEECHD